MKLMYLALRTRPDILLPLAHLSTFCKRPKHQHLQQLHRVLAYLNATPDYGLTFKPTSADLHCYIDASYAVHEDCRGHTGIIVLLGGTNAPLYVRSAKQKINTRSSTESELVALDEGMVVLQWLRDFLRFLGYSQPPVTVYQDNLSTIWFAEHNYSRSGRLRHLLVRFYYIKDLIERSIIKLEYCPTDLMLSDNLTKPKTGSPFTTHRDLLLNRKL